MSVDAGAFSLFFLANRRDDRQTRTNDELKPGYTNIPNGELALKTNNLLFIKKEIDHTIDLYTLVLRG